MATRVRTAWPQSERLEFVRVWQMANSVDEVVEKTHWERKLVQARANYLRSNGVVLQRFKQTKPDFTPLQRYAKELLKEKISKVNRHVPFA